MKNGRRLKEAVLRGERERRCDESCSEVALFLAVQGSKTGGCNELRGCGCGRLRAQITEQNSKQFVWTQV